MIHEKASRQAFPTERVRAIERRAKRDLSHQGDYSSPHSLDAREITARSDLRTSLAVAV